MSNAALNLQTFTEISTNAFIPVWNPCLPILSWSSTAWRTTRSTAGNQNAFEQSLKTHAISDGDFPMKWQGFILTYVFWRDSRKQRNNIESNENGIRRKKTRYVAKVQIDEQDSPNRLLHCLSSLLSSTLNLNDFPPSNDHCWLVKLWSERVSGVDFAILWTKPRIVDDTLLSFKVGCIPW